MVQLVHREYEKELRLRDITERKLSEELEQVRGDWKALVEQLEQVQVEKEEEEARAAVAAMQEERMHSLAAHVEQSMLKQETSSNEAHQMAEILKIHLLREELQRSQTDIEAFTQEREETIADMKRREDDVSALQSQLRDAHATIKLIVVEMEGCHVQREAALGGREAARAAVGTFIGQGSTALLEMAAAIAAELRGSQARHQHLQAQVVELQGALSAAGQALHEHAGPAATTADAEGHPLGIAASFERSLRWLESDMHRLQETAAEAESLRFHAVARVGTPKVSPVPSAPHPPPGNSESMMLLPKLQ